MTNKIKGYRNMAGFTQKEVAAEIVVSTTTYINKESNKFEFSKSEIEKIYKLLKTRISNLKLEDLFF